MAQLHKRIVISGMVISAMLAIALRYTLVGRSRPNDLLLHTPDLSAPIELVEIPPGDFLMGYHGPDAFVYPDAKLHPVQISYRFWMGTTEVTQRQWRELMGTTLRQHWDAVEKENADPFFQRLNSVLKTHIIVPESRNEYRWAKIKYIFVGYRRQLSGDGDDYPMRYINWNEAMDFCARLTEFERTAGRLPTNHEYRLPTEAEWEYACRAGSTTRFANGDTEVDLDQMAWYRDNSGDATHPVGTKLPNAWGLYDMHGNVREWCHCWYGPYPTKEVVDPFGPDTGSSKVDRGGDFISDSSGCSSYLRGKGAPTTSYYMSGFRVVLAPVLTTEREDPDI